MNLEQTLTDELASVAGSLDVPPPPAVAAVVQEAKEARSRSRLRWTATTLLAAAAVVAAVVAGDQIGHPDAAPSPAPQPTGLPTGAPPRGGYLSGSQLYIGDRLVPGKWDEVDLVGRTTLAYPQGAQHGTATRVVFRDGREVGRLTHVAVDQPTLLSPDGTKLAWVEQEGGRFFLDVLDVPHWRELGRLEGDRSRLGHRGTEDEAWETVTAVADDGTVTYGSVVVSHTWKPGSAPVDHLPGPSGDPNDFPHSNGGVVLSPDGTWGAWLTDRQGRGTTEPDQKTDAVTLARPRQDASQFTLRLPVGSDGRMLAWESGTNLLVTVYDDPSGDRWHLLRCDVLARRCEVAPTPGGS